MQSEILYFDTINFRRLSQALDCDADFDFFLTTRNTKLQAYQRLIYYMNLTGRLSDIYKEKLRYFDAEGWRRMGDLYAEGQACGWIPLLRRLRYMTNGSDLDEPTALPVPPRVAYQRVSTALFGQRSAANICPPAN